jgi:RNA polymerase sigma-70 factor (ECF subfamily)
MAHHKIAAQSDSIRKCPRLNSLPSNRTLRQENSMKSSETIAVGSSPVAANPLGQNATEALTEVLSKYSPRLFGLAFRMLGNAEDAEDALQEALLSAFRHFDQFKGEAKISTWLTSIVLNTARMQLRRRSNRHYVSLDGQAEEGAFAWTEMLAETGPGPEEIVRRTQLREVLERSAARLSPNIRIAFRLCVLEGLSTVEAAKRLGICSSAVKARVFRARAQITLQLQRALASPAKGKMRSMATRVRELGPSVTVSPEKSGYGQAA